MQQKVMGLTLPRQNGVPAYVHRQIERELNNPKRKIPKEKLLSDLLKRQARRIMQDITECQPNTVPAHIARLDDLHAIVLHCLNHLFNETAESLLSGGQLLCPSTLQDYFAAMQLTRTQHRCPPFINNRDEALARIEHKLDTLAGLFAQSPAINAVMEEEL